MWYWFALMVIIYFFLTFCIDLIFIAVISPPAYVLHLINIHLGIMLSSLALIILIVYNNKIINEGVREILKAITLFLILQSLIILSVIIGEIR